MLETPTIMAMTARPAAVIHLTIPRDQIQHEMGPAINEVFATIGAQLIPPAGALFDHHFAMDDQTFDFEVGVPVASPVSASGRVTPGELPGGPRVARAIYRGGYEGLGGAWGEFDAWLSANGHQPGPDLWEVFVKGPESGPDDSAWETELYRPLV